MNLYFWDLVALFIKTKKQCKGMKRVNYLSENAVLHHPCTIIWFWFLSCATKKWCSSCFFARVPSEKRATQLFHSGKDIKKENSASSSTESARKCCGPCLKWHVNISENQNSPQRVSDSLSHSDFNQSSPLDCKQSPHRQLLWWPNYSHAPTQKPHTCTHVHKQKARKERLWWQQYKRTNIVGHVYRSVTQSKLF